MKNVYYIIFILSFLPLLFQALVTFPAFQNSPKHLECHLWYMTDKPHRLSLKLDPGTNWIEINWWTVNVWHFERHCLQLNGCRQGSLIGAFQYLVCHENRQHSCYIVQEDTDWGRYWLNSRTRPMILFSTLVRSPTVRSGISLLLFHCDHWLFRSVQVPESEEPHAK